MFYIGLHLGRCYLINTITLSILSAMCLELTYAMIKVVELEIWRPGYSTGLLWPWPWVGGWEARFWRSPGTCIMRSLNGFQGLHQILKIVCTFLCQECIFFKIEFLRLFWGLPRGFWVEKGSEQLHRIICEVHQSILISGHILDVFCVLLILWYFLTFWIVY